MRVALATFAMFVVPGWLLVRHADEEGEWLVRLFAGLLVSACAYVLFGFAAYEFGLRLTGVEYVVPAVIVGVFVLVLMGPGSRSSAQFASVGTAVLLCSAAVLGTLVVHLALPSAPVEAAYSIDTSTVVVTATSVRATVTVDRVDTERPQVLSLFTRRTAAIHLDGPRGASMVTLIGRRPGTARGSCPQRIEILTSSGGYLTPPFHCAGF